MATNPDDPIWRNTHVVGVRGYTRVVDGRAVKVSAYTQHRTRTEELRPLKPGTVRVQTDAQKNTVILRDALMLADRGYKSQRQAKHNNVAGIAKVMLERSKTDPELARQLDVLFDVCQDNIKRYRSNGYLPKPPKGMSQVRTNRYVAASMMAAAVQETWADSATDTETESIAKHIWAQRRFHTVPLDYDLAHNQVDLEEEASEQEWWMKFAAAEGADFMAEEDRYQPLPDIYSGGGHRRRLKRRRAPIQETSGWLADQPAFRAVCDAMYDRTQDYLERAGIDTVQLYRGLEMKSGHQKRAHVFQPQKGGSRRKVHMNPLSSYATDLGQAKPFAGYGAGQYLVAEVPRERIFTIPLTGSGCLNEHEALVIAGPTNEWQTVFAANDLDPEADLNIPTPEAMAQAKKIAKPGQKVPFDVYVQLPEPVQQALTVLAQQPAKAKLSEDTIHAVTVLKAMYAGGKASQQKLAQRAETVRKALKAEGWAVPLESIGSIMAIVKSAKNSKAAQKKLLAKLHAGELTDYSKYVKEQTAAKEAELAQKTAQELQDMAADAVQSVADSLDNLDDLGNQAKLAGAKAHLASLLEQMYPNHPDLTPIDQDNLADQIRLGFNLHDMVLQMESGAPIMPTNVYLQLWELHDVSVGIGMTDPAVVQKDLLTKLHAAGFTASQMDVKVLAKHMQSQVMVGDDYALRTWANWTQGKIPGIPPLQQLPPLKHTVKKPGPTGHPTIDAAAAFPDDQWMQDLYIELADLQKVLDEGDEEGSTAMESILIQDLVAVPVSFDLAVIRDMLQDPKYSLKTIAERILDDGVVAIGDNSTLLNAMTAIANDPYMTDVDAGVLLLNGWKGTEWKHDTMPIDTDAIIDALRDGKFDPAGMMAYLEGLMKKQTVKFVSHKKKAKK